ncbi:Eukaryotic translation initiation factor SUI1 [Penicillium manginii]|uniref:Eukaryotic translation initiation factor SUI1 n=1 Tax=Penicillium manginii TaxID=203109 RepID=UPI00254723B2|nr:Eukaryotic translation initiation factor SUI1 [Penicillium manginii]KAJ5768033.1 Eukaryotic translation initiation factor SUI1 [Penicillium manginii]
MSSTKDMRRADLAIPYVDPPKSTSEADMSSTPHLIPPPPSPASIGTWHHVSVDSDIAAGTMSSTMPMAAMFTRNRMIGWVSFVFSLQSWLSESPEQKKNASTPAYMSVMMSLMALVVTYFPMFLPPQAKGGVAAPVPA